MIELADEIGKEHITALRDYFAALKNGTNFVCVMYDDYNPNALADLRKMGVSVLPDGRPGTELVYIPMIVWDTMRAHGLFNPATPVPRPTSEGVPKATLAVDGLQIGASRGEDLLKRRFLTWLLSRLPAKRNRWAVLVLALLWSCLTAAIGMLLP